MTAKDVLAKAESLVLRTPGGRRKRMYAYVQRPDGMVKFITSEACCPLFAHEVIDEFLKPLAVKGLGEVKFEEGKVKDVVAKDAWGLDAPAITFELEAG